MDLFVCWTLISVFARSPKSAPWELPGVFGRWSIATPSWEWYFSSRSKLPYSISQTFGSDFFFILFYTPCELYSSIVEVQIYSSKSSQLSWGHFTHCLYSVDVLNIPAGLATNPAGWPRLVMFNVSSSTSHIPQNTRLEFRYIGSKNDTETMHHKVLETKAKARRLKEKKRKRTKDKHGCCVACSIIMAEVSPRPLLFYRHLFH